jgi:hypothetical protein
VKLMNTNSRIFYLPAPPCSALRYPTSLEQFGFTVHGSYRFQDKPSSATIYPAAGKSSIVYAEQRLKTDELERSFEALARSMAVVRGDEEQEQFSFSDVHDFISKYGVHGLSLLNFAVTATSLPYLARYYFAYLLGHIDDPTTYRSRVEYLRNYERSDDEALRRGALEAFDHLSNL